MLKYKDIYTIRRMIGQREYTLNGATTEGTAAELATATINEEINSAYSAESKDYRQAWSICEITSPLNHGTIKALTLEEMADSLIDGNVIQYVDADGDVCKIWLSILRVFE